MSGRLSRFQSFISFELRLAGDGVGAYRCQPDENGGMSREPPDQVAPESADGLPFPDSLCHRCGAPPRYIRTERSTFIYCPIFKRYPPQPVWACDRFVPRVEPTEQP